MEKDDEILAQLAEHEQKLEEIYTSVEKMRKYFLWALIITLIAIILPLIGVAIALPSFLGNLQLGI